MNLRIFENDRSAKQLEFGKQDFRSVIKYLFMKGLSVKEIFAQLIETLADQCSSYATITNWVEKFKRGRSNV